MTRQTVAIDLGGTHVRAARVAHDGTIEARIRRKTPTADPDPGFLAALVEEVAAGAGVARVVLGVPGIVDHDAEVLIRAPNLPPDWIAHLTGASLSAAIGVPVALANDADLAAVGEAAFGAGRGERDVVYVTISTGVGAGIVVDRTLVRGRHSGGEIGHTVIDWGAALAGRPATVEELGAGPAIAAAAAAAGLVERDAELAHLVRSGHTAATEVWNRAITAVGIGVVNLAWLISPQVVVIGGGVGNNSDIVLPVIEHLLERHGPAVESRIAVVAAHLGDDAGLAGGAAWFEAVGHRELTPGTADDGGETMTEKGGS